jgi:hypothetical protein
LPGRAPPLDVGQHLLHLLILIGFVSLGDDLGELLQ